MMSRRFTLQLVFAGLIAFSTTSLLVRAPQKSYAGPGPSEFESNGQIVASFIDELSREVYMLDSGDDSVIVGDIDTQEIKTTISLTSIEGAVDDMSFNKSSKKLVVSSDGGGIYTVDPATSNVTTVVENTATGPAGVLANIYTPSVDAYFYDGISNDLRDTSTGLTPIVMAAPGVSGPMRGMYEQENTTGVALAPIMGLQKGSAIVWSFNRDTLVDYDDTLSSVTPTGGTYAEGSDYFVTVNNSGQGELHRVDLTPASFGFLSPAEATFSDSAMDVSYSNGFVAVTLSTSSNETELEIYDFGDRQNLLHAGTFVASSSKPSAYATSISIAKGMTLDDLHLAVPLLGTDAGTGSISGDWASFDGIGPGTITGPGFDGGPTPGDAPFSHSAHQCTGCPPEETIADGFKINPSTPNSVEFSTGEEMHLQHLFSVPGIGMDLDFTLTYRSRRDHDYRYGKNWFLNHDARMKTETNGDESYRSGYGLHELYVKNGANYLAPHNYDTTLVVNAGSRTVTDRFGTATVYNASGYRTSVTDRYGNAIQYTWTSDKLTSITDTRGKTYTLNYDGSGRLSSIVDFGGRTWAMEYDYRGCLIKITTPSTTQHASGRVHRFSYSASNTSSRLEDNLIHIWSPKGDKVQTLEYSSGDVVLKEHVGPGTYSMSYDLVNSKTTVIDPSGNTTEWSFDTQGYVTSKKQFTKGLRTGEPASYTTSYTIGSTSNLIEAVVHPRGNRVEFSYDAVFNLLQVTRKETNTTSSSGNDIVVTHQYNGAFNQRTQTTDARGNVTTYTVDSSGNTTAIQRQAVTNPASQTVTETFAYDSFGRVTSASDGAGRSTSFNYYTSGTQNGWLQSVVRDPGGLALTTTFAYDQYGNVTSVTDPRGNATTFTVDAENFITQIQAPSPFNYKTKFTYDENGDLVQTEVENRDRNGALDATTPWITTTYGYNEVSWRTSKTAPLDASTSAVTSYEYQGAGLVSKIINAEGEETEILYDERDLLFKITRGLGTADATTTQFDYDINGNRTTTTNGRGKVSTRTFDLFDRTERVTNPLGNYVEFTYDKASNVTGVSAFDAGDVLQAARTNHFDEIDRLWKIERSRFGPGLTTTTPTTTIKRDEGHLVLEVTDPLARKTTRTYDAAGRVLTMKDPASNEVQYTYDANGNATVVDRVEVPTTGPSETFRTEYDFDELNRTETRREVDRLNSSNILTTTFEYDSRGNLTFRTDAEGNPVRWGYDLASRMTDYERALAIGASIDVFTDSIHETMSYDKVHRLLTVTDDNFNATNYEYDNLGRTKKTTFADSKYVTRTFDANSNVASWTDQNGSAITNTYDSNDRLVQRNVTRGTGVQGTTVELYGYDALDRLTHAEDDDFQFDRVWDSVGYLLSEDQGYTATGQEKWKTVSTSWNDAGATTNVTYPSGRIFTHNRDSIDRLTSIFEVLTSSTVSSFTWQGRGRKATTAHQNGTTTEYGYDGFARTSSIEHFTPAVQNFHRFDYAYDKVHNRRMEKNTFSGAWVTTLPAAVQAFLNARNTKGDVYAYDMANRMVNARYDVTNPLTEVATPGSQTYVTLVGYTLDGLGNRSQVQTTPWGGPPATTTYASDVVNQYTTIAAVTRTHDNNGNLKDDGTNLYFYDYKNRLVEVKLKSTNATKATYKYDAAGRRVEKDVGGTITRYVLDGVSVIEEYDGTNAWQASYIHDDRIDHPCAMDRADIADVDGDANTTEVFRFHYAQSALGSVSEMTDPTGTVVEWVTYDIYGAPTVRDQNGAIVASSAIGNPFLYTGREWDIESGKYFYRARTYDPSAGRFLQRDALGYVDGLSLHQYAQSNSATRSDPLGLDSTREEAIKKIRAAREAVKKAREAQQKKEERIADLEVQIEKLKEKLETLRECSRQHFSAHWCRRKRDVSRDLKALQDQLKKLQDSPNEFEAALAGLEQALDEFERLGGDGSGDPDDIKKELAKRKRRDERRESYGREKARRVEERRKEAETTLPEALSTFEGPFVHVFVTIVVTPYDLFIIAPITDRDAFDTVKMANKKYYDATNGYSTKSWDWLLD